MNHKKFTSNRQELSPNKSYLTNIYGYSQKTTNIFNYNGVYILESELQRLGTLFPEIATMLSEVFCIPLMIDDNKMLCIEKVYTEKIQQTIDHTNEQVKEMFESTQEDFYKKEEERTYEGIVYRLVQDLVGIVKDGGFDNDRETMLTFQDEVNDLEKSLRYFLHQDLTLKLQNYSPTSDTIDPIVQQIVFIHRRIEQFLQKLPPAVEKAICIGHQGHFHDIKMNAIAHLCQKYPPLHPPTIPSEPIQENVQQMNETYFNNAVNYLRIAIFQLNYIFQNPEEDENGSKTHEIHPYVNILFDKLLKYKSKIDKKPESQNDINKINDYIGACIVDFIRKAYEGSIEQHKLLQMHHITRNLGNSIHEAIDSILQYKKYPIISSEYKFMKDILTQLHQDYINYPDMKSIAPSITEQFTRLYELETKFVASLSPEELQSLIIIATHYDQLDFLIKLQNHGMISAPKKID